MRHTIFIVIALTIFTLFNLQVIVPTAYGKENVTLSTKKEIINPGSIYYPLKRVWENIRERFVFSSGDKAEFYGDLLEVRLSELEYVTRNKILEEFERSSHRFSYQAGELVNTQSGSGKKEVNEEIMKQFTSYNQLLEELRDLYPANSSYWLLIQQNIDTLKILSDKLK